MMKRILILAGLLLCSLWGLAQTDDLPVVVIASGGKIEYTSADKSVKIKVVPGAVVKKSGTLKLASKASAVLYCDGRIQQALGKSTVKLVELFPADAVSPLNFDPRFGRYIRMAVELTAIQSGQEGTSRSATRPPQQVGDGWTRGVTDTIRSTDGWGRGVTDTIRSSDGWGRGVTDTIKSTDGWGQGVTDTIRSTDGWGRGVTDTIKSTDGWGGYGNRIVAILPEGKVLPAPVLFFWSKPAGAKAYEVEIQDEKNAVLHKVTTADTAVTIDLGMLKLEAGQQCYWRVRVPDMPRMASNPKPFVIGTAAEQSEDVKKAAKSRVYGSGGAEVQGLMEAVALEETEWYSYAQTKYAELLKAHPKNYMVRMLYGAYWVRAGVTPKAKAVMNN